MKGDRFSPEHSTYKDRATGTLVHQLTERPCINHATYFLQSSFTPDGRALIFVSYRSGNAAQLYEVAPFPSGEIRQLTDGVPIHPFSPAIHPAGETIFFVRQGGIWSLNRETLAETCIADFPGAQLGECSLGDSGRWLTAAGKRGSESGIVAGRADGRDAGLAFHPVPADRNSSAVSSA
jgi:Tol biopolymer transport system component